MGWPVYKAQVILGDGTEQTLRSAVPHPPGLMAKSLNG